MIGADAVLWTKEQWGTMAVTEGCANLSHKAACSEYSKSKICLLVNPDDVNVPAIAKGGCKIPGKT